MRFWLMVMKAAWLSTKDDLKLSKSSVVVVMFLTQIAVGVGAWFLAGDAGLATRLSSAAAPFLLIPIVLAWKMIATPPVLYASLSDREHKLRKVMEDELKQFKEAARRDTEAEKHDMRIADLFRGIDSGVDTSEVIRSCVGIEILDNLSTNFNFRAYGRVVDPARKTPLKEIYPSYWEHAVWTYYFLRSGAPNIDCQRSKDGRGSDDYYDVRVSRRQASKIWPHIDKKRS